MEEEREGKKLLGSQGKSKTDYFKDKFIISLKIQYGCRLENVTDCGREGVNNVRRGKNFFNEVIIKKVINDLTDERLLERAEAL